MFTIPVELRHIYSDYHYIFVYFLFGFYNLPLFQSEIHLQFFKLHGREEFTPEDFDHLHKIEPNSAQFALYCKSSSPEASIKLASLLMIPSHSSLLNVYDVVDNRRIQLGLLLNLIDENIDGWSSFYKDSERKSWNILFQQ